MEIIGHQKQWNFLKRISETNKLAHAYLFTGEEKIGKKKVALEWASLLCEPSPKHHPDLILIEPINKIIQISQIRELIWKLSLKFYSAPFKIAIIDNAHLMNQEAQNALLKILEEPKGKTLLILITEFPEVLYPTILSRVQKIKFYPVKKKEIKEYLIKKGLKEEEAEEMSEFSYSKPGLAIDFLSDSEKLKNQKKIIKELIILIKSNLSFRFQYAKELSEKENIKEVLDIWLRYFRKELLTRTNLIKQIQNMGFLISTTNVNIRLALETLMLEF